jgi:hypothetical protein
MIPNDVGFSTQIRLVSNSLEVSLVERGSCTCPVSVRGQFIREGLLNRISAGRGSSGKAIEYIGGRGTRYLHVNDFHGGSRQDTFALLASNLWPLSLSGLETGVRTYTADPNYNGALTQNVMFQGGIVRVWK